MPINQSRRNIFGSTSAAPSSLNLSDGTVTALPIKFEDDQNTGIYSSANETINLVTNGTSRLALNTTALTNTLPFYGPNGTLETPTYAFANDTNSGMFLSADAEVSISTNGVSRARFGASESYFGSSQLVQFQGGSQFAPEFCFSNDKDTGMYYAGTNSVGLSTGGTGRFILDTSSISTTLPIRSSHTTNNPGIPAYSFSGDTNTGMYSVSADVLGLSAGGVLALSLKSNQALLPDGTAALPGISFNSEDDMGIYRAGLDSIGFSTAGTLRLTLNTTSLTSTLPFLGPNGSASAPTFSFSGDSNTGIFQAGTADTMALTTGGTVRLTLNTTDFITSVPINTANGTASAPSYRFNNDSNTGIYHTGTADTMALATGGTQRLTLNTVSLTSTLPYYAPDGSATAPSYTFTSDTDCGFYRNAANSIRFCNGLADGYFSLQVSQTEISGVANNDLVDIPRLTNFQAYGSAYNGDGYYTYAQTSSTTGYNHILCVNNGGNAWRVRGDGATFADGAYSSAGADYAEWFESSDGKEIPCGSTVVLDGTTGKIKLAEAGDEAKVIGVVRPKNDTNGCVVIGNSAEGYWNSKFEKDEYGKFIYETVEYWKWTDLDGKYHGYYSNQVPDGVVVPENKEIVPNQQMKKLNPSYDPELAYQPRSSRPEWHVIGMIGQIPVKNGQILGSNWQLLKNINDGTVAKLYLVK